MVTRSVADKRSFEVESFQDSIGSKEDWYRALSNYNYATLWTRAANAILALWLITAPHLYRYNSAPLSFSDTVCGVLVIALEAMSFASAFFWVRWLIAPVAAWLLMAPLVFWSPSPATYLGDTVIAALLLTFAFLIPGTPGQAGLRQPGPDQPPGWTYNPSSWIRRWLGIALALLGFLISRYLAVHQLGYMPHAWDPLFGTGTDHVLHSNLSRSFPVSDAGFGAVAYILEVLAGFMGDRARWRTAPWAVTTFAFVVVPLGVTSILLVITQPVVVHHWCGLCLIAAVALLASVPLAVHEIVAMGLFLLEAKRRGKNVWQVFWFGGTIHGAGRLDPDRRRFTLGQRWVVSIQGVTVPWNLALQLFAGIWLMLLPTLMPSPAFFSNCEYFLGALALTIAAVATAEVTRTVRWLNVIVGLALCVLSFLPGHPNTGLILTQFVCGIVLIETSMHRGELFERYGAWDKFIK